jgi:hypothetical protein
MNKERRGESCIILTNAPGPGQVYQEVAVLSVPESKAAYTNSADFCRKGDPPRLLTSAPAPIANKMAMSFMDMSPRC